MLESKNICNELSLNGGHKEALECASLIKILTKSSALFPKVYAQNIIH